MFNFLRKKATKNQLQTVTLKLSGLHCSSCGMSIDNALEENTAVSEAATSYARAETKVSFDPALIDIEGIKKIINKAGYQVL
jgi:Cu+-exporting ATPase